MVQRRVIDAANDAIGHFIGNPFIEMSSIVEWWSLFRVIEEYQCVDSKSHGKRATTDVLDIGPIGKTTKAHASGAG
jgi:hypothetical protein